MFFFEKRNAKVIEIIAQTIIDNGFNQQNFFQKLPNFPENLSTLIQDYFKKLSHITLIKCFETFVFMSLLYLFYH